jgi:hypothetical protein
VDRPLLEVLAVARIIEAHTKGVEHVPLDAIADRHRDRGTGVGHLGAAHQAIGGLHRYAAHQVVAEVLGDLEGQGFSHRRQGDFSVQGIEQLRHLAARELHVDDRAGDAHHSPGRLLAAGS